MSFDHSVLPRNYPRKYLPSHIDFADTVKLGGFFDKLEKKSTGTRQELEAWLEQESELLSVIGEEQAMRYIRMTCQTDDSTREKAHLEFIEKIEPLVKVRAAELDRKYLASPSRKALESNRFSILDRRKENSVAIFREANVELEKEDARLGQKYQKVTGAMTVLYEGQERTMQQMARFLEEPDRAVREKTWLLAEERRLKDREVLNKVYDDLLSLRARIATNAGFSNYRDFMFRKLYRFDYSPEDCFRFHNAIERYFVPLSRELDEDRRTTLRLDILRPWDMHVDPENLPALRPFKDSRELVERTATAVGKVDPDFEKSFRRMMSLNLLDLDSRKGKAPGGYNYELPEVQLPFIFMNSVGRDGDLRALLHESGHAFQVFATRSQNLHFQLRGENVPSEIAEVASQTMELLAGEHLEGIFYNHSDYARAKRKHLTSLVKLLPWVATVDAFQHWIYTHPGHSVSDREEYWVKLRGRFGEGDNWDGFEQYWRSRWQRQLHLYQVPFYYIEYGISLLGALGIWYNYRKNPTAAVTAYMKTLALGGSRPLPELFRTATVPFDFGPKTIEPIATELRNLLVSK